MACKLLPLSSMLTASVRRLAYGASKRRRWAYLRDVELLAEVGVNDEFLRCSAAAAAAVAVTPRSRRRDDQELVAQVRERLQAGAAAQRRPDADAVAHLARAEA